MATHRKLHAINSQNISIRFYKGETTMAGVPTNRTNISLPPEVAAEILAKTQEASAVMSLARQIALPGRGL